MNTTCFSLVRDALTSTIDTIDTNLEGFRPTTIIGAVLIAKFAIDFFASYIKPRWQETTQEHIGRLALSVPYVEERYNKDIDKEYQTFKVSVQQLWKQFGAPLTDIPQEPWTHDQLIQLTDRYAEITESLLAGRHFSGAIYPKSLTKMGSPVEFNNRTLPAHAHEEEYFQELASKSESVFTHGYERSYLWNLLHNKEFGIGSFIEYQVVRMVAGMFGGTPQQVKGFVTTGGTESLMQAVRLYKEWGRKTLGIPPGESVIIAGRSIHAAVLKAGETYDVKIVLVDCDHEGRIDLKNLKDALQSHGNKVVAIFGSTPSYATGVIDPIFEMGELAKAHGCGLHVDACLGSFIVNNLPQHGTDYLNMNGVTSLSADTHKNGLAPKGTSVLVTKKLGKKNLAYYSIYSIPNWMGGVYATPKAPGSEPCTPALTALLALLGTSKSGYAQAATHIHKTACQLAHLIEGCQGKLKLVAQPEVNVVAFRVHAQSGWKKGAIYAIAHEMHKRNVTLNTMNDQIVHMCVTVRFASDPEALQQFNLALTEAIAIVEKMNADGLPFPGDAGMYCALSDAISPKIENLSTQKYIENALVGKIGAKDAARAYWMARLDPFDGESWA
jgi:glutamate/tyrosine decarboxylase-like PLP-dependent enzyme